MNSKSSICLVILVSLLCTDANASKLAIPSKTETLFRNIEKEYHVRIHSNYSRKEFFPEFWLRKPINAEGTPISNANLARLSTIIDKFLKAHPKKVSKKFLSDIYLMDSLKCYGIEYGATYYESSIFITCRKESDGYDEKSLLGLFNAEFSSILFQANKFPKNEWLNANPPKFKYSKNEVGLLKRNDNYKSSTALLERGFLVPYSQSNLENDFNIISDWLFSKGSELTVLSEKYLRIKRKMNLAIEFYKSIDPDYSFPKSHN